MERTTSRNVRAREGLASAIDIAHKYVIMPLIFGGQIVMGTFWHSAFLVVVIGLQLAFRDCPVTVLARWLRSNRSPQGTGSGLVGKLYRRMGRWAAIPIALYLFGIAYMVGIVAL